MHWHSSYHCLKLAWLCTHILSEIWNCILCVCVCVWSCVLASAVRFCFVLFFSNLQSSYLSWNTGTFFLVFKRNSNNKTVTIWLRVRQFLRLLGEDSGDSSGWSLPSLWMQRLRLRASASVSRNGCERTNAAGVRLCVPVTQHEWHPCS